MSHRSGRHFLQLPGPTNVPDRVLRAIDQPTIDHRGPGFAELTKTVLAGLQEVFKTKGHVVVYPASGSGAWEASLVNTLSPGDSLLGFDHGYFALTWSKVAARLGLHVELVPSDWRRAVNLAVLEEKLTADREHRYRAVLIVHNETSTGATTNVAAVRKILDRVRHPALLMVDAVSSLGAIDYRHDDWKVDVTVAGSQKGLMLPPGLSFNAISTRALEANKRARLPRSYWSWEDILEFNATGFYPYTPATNLLFGLREALEIFREEGLEHVFARHHRLATATRRAVAAWGLQVFASEPSEQSDCLTALLMPEGVDADRVRRVILERFDMSLGAGLGKIKGKVFRIGHLGDLNELMLAGTLCGVEMGLLATGAPITKGGVGAALDYLGGVSD